MLFNGYGLGTRRKLGHEEEQEWEHLNSHDEVEVEEKA